MTPGIIIAVVYLVVIAALVITVWVIVHKIKKKIRQYSRSLFGTEDFIKGYAKQAASLESEPRSLNGMTDVLLPNIIRDFPEFNFNELRSKAEMLIKTYFNALESEDIGLLKDEQISDVLRDKAESIILDFRSQDRRIFFNDIVIYNTEISDYSTGNGRCTISLQSAVGAVNYITDRSGSVVGGSREKKRQMVMALEYTYIQDARKLSATGRQESYSLSCPNCGAPVLTLGAKFCEYCGTGIKEINIKSWKFTNIEEHGIRAKQYY